MHDMRAGTITVCKRGEQGKTDTETVPKEDYDPLPNSKEIDLGGFIDALEQDQPCNLNGELARHSCEICLAATESAQTGQRVTITAPTVDVQVK